MAEQVTIYSPNRRHEYGIVKIWVIMARNVYESRELIWQLFKRDFLAQYKKSFVGYTWVVLSPLIGVASWIFLQATGVLNSGDVGIPYPAYVLVGSSMWGLFMGFFQSASLSLRSGEGLMTQVKFPHEALFFIQLGQHMANFAIVFLMNIVVLLALGVVPAWQTILLPLVCLPMLFLGGGIGLINGLIGAVSPDLQRIIQPALGFMLYVTPVIYSDQVE
ncbi:MAG: ABC transporter permease, partial [Leptospiraceae bacterium]|nr:ABC transporter permease [Leptospiraceae bacterium]